MLMFFDDVNWLTLLPRFKTRRGKMFCVRPEEKWAQELMKHIDKRLQQTKPDKRCS